MSLFDDLVSINSSLSSTLQGINSLLPYEAETLKDAPLIIEVAIGSARQEGEESGYDIGYDVGYGNAASIIVSTSNEVIERYTAPAEDWSELPSKIEEVYEAGKAAGGGGEGDGYSAFFSIYCSPVARDIDYMFAGPQWSANTFKPPAVTLKPTRAMYMFARCSLKGDLAELFDSFGFGIDFSECVYLDNLFNNATGITRLGVLNFSGASASANNVFINATGLKTIDKIIVSENTKSYTNWFSGVSNLEEVRFEGIIDKSISLNGCKKLSKASIQSIYAVLSMAAGMSDNTVTLSLVAVNKAFETSEGANDGSTSTEWQNLVSGTPWRTVLN